MRRRLAAAGALLLSLTGCATRGPLLPVPPSGLPLAAAPPSLLEPPREGSFGSATSREVTLAVCVGERKARMRAYCRVGVWTTLSQTRPRGFVTRESWGRLGERPAKRLAQVRDQAIDGVVARIRPEPDGGTSFVVEIARVTLGRQRPVGFFHGQRITLGSPRRHGYRFVGRAPAGWQGAVARWGPELQVLLDAREGESAPPGALHFAGGDERGFVAGERPAAEAFTEAWEPTKPIHVDAEGVERKDYRLVLSRRAAGFRYGKQGRMQTHGADFRLSRDAP